MERLLTLLGQDEEILYLELARLSYKDMKAFCDLTKNTRKLCSEDRFRKLLRQKKEELLLHLKYLKLKELCKTYEEVQDICNDDKFWEKKYYRDFGKREIEYPGMTWKEKYEYRFRKASRRLINKAIVGDISAVKELLEFGVDPNYINNTGNTALRQAARYGHAEVVRLLLAGGADIDLKNRTTGGTALMVASVRGEPEIVEILLKAGADPNIHLLGGETAFGFASKLGHNDVVDVFRKYGISK